MGRNILTLFSLRVKFSIFLILLFYTAVSGYDLKNLKRDVSKLKGFDAVVAYDLTDNKFIINKNGNKLFKPASTLKIITTYAYLKKFSMDKQFSTKVYLDKLPNKDGVLNGNIYIYGDGDPSLSYRFFDNSRDEPVEYFLDSILKKFNIKKIKGNIVVDDSKFLYKPYGPSWSWEVFQWAYGVKVSALSLNDNTFNIELLPTKNGKRVNTSITPKYLNKYLVNNCITSKYAKIDDLIAFKPFDSDRVYISGYLPISLVNWNLKIAVTDPALYFGNYLREIMENRGIEIKGSIKVIHRYHFMKFKRISYKNKPLVEIKGKKVREVIKKMLKKSINLYAELLLRDLGVTEPFFNYRDERKNGISMEYKLLKGILNSKNSLIVDGSGLSQRNLITPMVFIKILKKIHRAKNFSSFLNFLPISGEDGTLKHRMGGRYRKRIFAKTGQIEEVVSRVGYIKTFSNKLIAFVLVTNNDPNYKLNTKNIFDRICKVLCNY